MWSTVVRLPCESMPEQLNIRIGLGIFLPEYQNIRHRSFYPNQLFSNLVCIWITTVPILAIYIDVSCSTFIVYLLYAVVVDWSYHVKCVNFVLFGLLVRMLLLCFAVRKCLTSPVDRWHKQKQNTLRTACVASSHSFLNCACLYWLVFTVSDFQYLSRLIGVNYRYFCFRWFDGV